MNTSDRELLELAAKAAGYEVIQHHQPKHGDGALSAAWAGPWLEVKKPEAPLGNCRWNPLTDDADAFRLAVKLRINIMFNGGFHHIGTDRHIGDVCRLGNMSDIRREIVVVAASIGKAMTPLTADLADRLQSSVAGVEVDISRPLDEQCVDGEG